MTIGMLKKETPIFLTGKGYFAGHFPNLSFDKCGMTNPLRRSNINWWPQGRIIAGIASPAEASADPVP